MACSAISASRMAAVMKCARLCQQGVCGIFAVEKRNDFVGYIRSVFGEMLEIMAYDDIRARDTTQKTKARTQNTASR